jgi:hypothetical protein
MVSLGKPKPVVLPSERCALLLIMNDAFACTLSLAQSFAGRVSRNKQTVHSVQEGECRTGPEHLTCAWQTVRHCTTF